MNISRRSVLKGAGGIALGLPWLEAMAVGNFSQNNVRMAFLFMPNGCYPKEWDPKGKGSSYELSPALNPLKDLKGDVNVHTNLFHPLAKKGDGHYAKTANFLSGKVVKKSTSDLHCGISADQVAAKQIGQNTFLPSIELAVHKTRNRIDTNVGFTQVYGGHISWSSDTVPVAKETIPLQAFNRLFKSSLRKTKTQSADVTKSILDYIKEDTARLNRYLGKEDRYRVNQYFASVRALEHRIQKASKLEFTMPDDAKTPAKGKPKSYDEHVDLMLDLIVLAFQTQRTKIATFMFGNSVSGQNFSFLDGVEGGHHEISHHKNDQAKLKMLGLIAKYHVKKYSEMLGKMKAIKEGNSTLLDNSLILFGSGLKEPNSHNPVNLPIIVGGKGGGLVKTGNHYVHKPKTKMNNLLLGMMTTAGCKLSEFGDSEEPII